MSIQDVRRLTNKLLTTVDEWEPEEWYPLAGYSVKGQSAGWFLKNILRRREDPSGVYLFRTKFESKFEEVIKIPLQREIFYVGRAGKIARRLQRHLKVKKHNSASLVYKLTAMGMGMEANTRDSNMASERFRVRFCAVQSHLRDFCEMSYLEANNDETQAIIEILMSLKLRTQFNDWKTH